MNPNPQRFDQLPRYVRVRSEPDATFVEFDFAIGYPDLFFELVVPREAFTRFGEQNRVRHVDARMAEAIESCTRELEQKLELVLESFGAPSAVT